MRHVDIQEIDPTSLTVMAECTKRRTDKVGRYGDHGYEMGYLPGYTDLAAANDQADA